MPANLALTHGSVGWDAVMKGLAPFLGRLRAHELVYELCRKAATGGEPLPTLLVAEPEVIRYLDKGALPGLTDPETI